MKCGNDGIVDASNLLNAGRGMHAIKHFEEKVAIRRPSIVSFVCSNYIRKGFPSVYAARLTIIKSSDLKLTLAALSTIIIIVKAAFSICMLARRQPRGERSSAIWAGVAEAGVSPCLSINMST